MKEKTWLVYLICIAVTEAVGFAAGMFTREGTKIYSTTIVKPPLSPPPLVFPIAWSILYLLMAVGIARIWISSAEKGRTLCIILYIIQLVFNFLWCFIFFSFQKFGLAFIWLVILLALVIAMTRAFAMVDRTASIMQIPYIVWLIFAGYLNAGVWLLNR